MTSAKFKFFIYLLLLGMVIRPIKAYQEVIDISSIKTVALFLHSIEIILAIIICYLAVLFFRITKPNNFFLYIYFAGGFLVISSLFFVVYYLFYSKLNTDFSRVYLASRISLIAMLVSLTWVFYYIHAKIRSKF